MQRLVDGARAVERALVEGDVVRLVVLGKSQVRQADVRDAGASARDVYKRQLESRLKTQAS